MASQTTSTTTADGLVTSEQRDLDGDGVTDQTSTDTMVYNADGSTQETIQTYQTSQIVGGVATSMSPLLSQQSVVNVSADGKTTTSTLDPTAMVVSIRP